MDSECLNVERCVINPKNFQIMTDLQDIATAESWLMKNRIEDNERTEFESLVRGRSMLYAPVDQPKSFVSDIKSNTGRLTDFNKGMYAYSSSFIS